MDKAIQGESKILMFRLLKDQKKKDAANWHYKLNIHGAIHVKVKRHKRKMVR